MEVSTMSASLSPENFPSLATTPQRQWARARSHKAPIAPPVARDAYLELALSLATRYPPDEWELLTVATAGTENGDMIERLQFRRRAT